MSTHNICFYWEIRKISAVFGWKKCLICYAVCLAMPPSTSERRTYYKRIEFAPNPFLLELIPFQKDKPNWPELSPLKVYLFHLKLQDDCSFFLSFFSVFLCNFLSVFYRQSVKFSLFTVSLLSCGMPWIYLCSLPFLLDFTLYSLTLNSPCCCNVALLHLFSYL